MADTYHVQKLSTAEYSALLPTGWPIAYESVAIYHNIGHSVIPGHNFDLARYLWQGGFLEITGWLTGASGLSACLEGRATLAAAGITLHNLRLASLKINAEKVSGTRAGLKVNIKLSFTGYS